MVWNFRVAIVLIAGILIGPNLPAGAAELSDGVVRIGIINDQTGPLSDLSGLGSVTAARMAADDFQKLVPSIKV